MIAMLLAAQLSAEIVRGMPADAVAPPNAAAVRAQPFHRGGLITALPAPANCLGAGRMEASFADPAALYRNGDRPPKMYLRWESYPDGRLCRLGGAP